jgi:hypothetical protein
MGSAPGYEDRPELIPLLCLDSCCSACLVADEVAIALLLLAGIALVYVIGIRADPHDRGDEKRWIDRRR